MDNRDDNIIEVSFEVNDELDYSELDIEILSIEQLSFCLDELNEKLIELDKNEPKNIESDEYEEWADEHEDLEDLIDDIRDRIDELRYE